MKDARFTAVGAAEQAATAICRMLYGMRQCRLNADHLPALLKKISDADARGAMHKTISGIDVGHDADIISEDEAEIIQSSQESWADVLDAARAADEAQQQIHETKLSINYN